MVFAHENSADVAQILLHPEQVRLAAANGELEIWGYWQDDYFYVQKMDYGWLPFIVEILIRTLMMHSVMGFIRYFIRKGKNDRLTMNGELWLLGHGE